MVICVKVLRLLTVTTTLLILLPVRPSKCQLSATTNQKTTTQCAPEVVPETQNPEGVPIYQKEFGECGPQCGYDMTEAPEQVDQCECVEGSEDYTNENSPVYENDNYEEFYDDNDDDVCKERKYGRFLLIGSAILLVLGLCGLFCFMQRKDNDMSCPSITTCFRSYSEYETVEETDDVEDDDDDACIVNFMKPTPELSEAESDYQNIPLPLIYEDMGKICNNAEMFIQRCMTSSVKRTYSEPVKTMTSSRTKFRDYFKELAYLKEKQTQECTKHGAVKAFFKEMFNVFRRSDVTDGRRRDPMDSNKETRVRIEDSTKDIMSRPKGPKAVKPIKKRERDSSSSISITSLLLKPQYQAKYYKKEKPFDNCKPRKKEVRDPKVVKKCDGEKIPLIINQKKPPQTLDRRLELSRDLRQHKIRPQDTEELIKICVNSMRQPFNKKLFTIFDQHKLEQYNGMQDVAATMAKKMTVERDRSVGDGGRGLREPFYERSYGLPSCSRDLTPLTPKQSKESLETFDLLVKQLYMMTNNRNIPHSDNGAFIVPREHGAQGDAQGEAGLSRGFSNSTEEDARSRMIRKYQELQMEVERLNKSLRQFAVDFLYADSNKSPLDSYKRNDSYTPRRAKKK